MRILFLFVAYPEDKEGSYLTKDLPDALAERGESVYVATIREKRLGLETAVSDEYGKNILRVKTGNMFNETHRLQKGLTMLTFNRTLLHEIKNNWGDVSFDLIVGSTPYTANHSLISGLKNHFKCPAFLILWDIFPQNAKDLGFIKNSFLFKYLKRREIKSLKQFDHIGCMTNGNIRYLKQHYPFLREDRFCLFPLWTSNTEAEETKAAGRADFGFNEEDFIFVYGGNIGVPQNLQNVIDLANQVKNISTVRFLIIGEGSEYRNVKKKVEGLNLSNVTFMKQLDRERYEAVMKSCDVGLVSLHPDFSVPNFPSKTVEYLKHGLPILAALDATALGDYGKFVQDEARVGLCCHANDMAAYKDNLLRLYRDRELYSFLAGNAPSACADNFSIVNNCDRLLERCAS